MDAWFQERPHLQRNNGHKQFIDTEGFNWKEAMEVAMNKRPKFPLNRLFGEQRVPKTVGGHSEDGLGAYYKI